jgi:DNA-binding phage protein
MKPALTVSYDEMIINRLKTDREFSAEMFKGAIEALFESDYHYALRTLRCIVKAGIGFTALSNAVGISSQNLHRALSDRGNPTIRTLNKIISAIADFLGVARPQPHFA